MTIKEQNYLNMLRRVQQTLNDYESVWTSNTFFTERKQQIDALLQTVDAKNLEEQLLKDGNTLNRKQTYQVLAKKLCRLQASLLVLAASRNDESIRTNVGRNKTNIMRASLEAFLTLARANAAAARQYESELQELGVQPSLIAEVEALASQFQVQIATPQVIRHALNVLKKARKDAIQEANNLLRKRLDPLVLLYEEEAVDFFRAYQYARSIIDRRASQKLPKSGEEETPGSPAADA